MSTINTLKHAIAEVLTAMHQHPENKEQNLRAMRNILSVIREALSDPLWEDKANATPTYAYALNVLTHALSDPALGMTKARTTELVERAETAMRFIEGLQTPDPAFKYTVLPGSPKDNGFI